MSNRILQIHWNELSFPEDITAEALRRNGEWSSRAREAFDALILALKSRRDCRISVAKGTFHHNVAGRPFKNWLEELLGKERFQKLRMNVIQPGSIGELPSHELDVELSCLDRCGEGITRAHISETWAWSLANQETGSERENIEAQKILVDQDQPIPVQVANLACEKHFLHWAQAFEAWGEVVSQNHVISSLAKYQIIMYPLDHGYPHIHVHAVDDPRLNAKYRVDVFEPLTSAHPKGLDSLMKKWIDEHRENLLLSWRRCERGGYPLKL